MSDYAEHPELPPAQHERSDIPAARLGLGIAGVGVVLVLLGVLVAALFPASLKDRTIAGRILPFPAPQLQRSPRADMARFFSQQMRAVNGVWWVDRGRGIVHLPIDDAMRKLAQEGVADWPQARIDAKPRDAELRDGSPPSSAVERQMQQNVVNDSLVPAPAP